MKYEVFLPLPPACLSPNARPHWAQKSKAVKQYRAERGRCFATGHDAENCREYSRCRCDCTCSFTRSAARNRVTGSTGRATPTTPLPR